MYKKTIKGLMFSLLLIFIASTSTSVYADAVSNIYITPSSINFKSYSIVSKVTDRGTPPNATAEAIAEIRSRSGNVPIGYMGGHARLFTSTGTLWASGAITYNDSVVVSHYNYSPRTSASGLYYAQVRGLFYNGDGYDTHTGYKSPIYTLDNNTSLRQAPDTNLLSELESLSAYEVNENGETYGSALSAKTIGQEPDLISAIGTNGVEGYVKSSDFDTGVTSPEEATAYMNSLGDATTIPLYDVDGITVLGEFMIENITE